MGNNSSKGGVIFRVICESDRPLDPGEIHERAERIQPGLGIATVYRHLKAFLEEGILRTVEVPGEPRRFESAALEHHHHFYCEICGKVFDLHGCDLEFAYPELEGFKVKRHEVMHYGICGECTLKN